MDEELPEDSMSIHFEALREMSHTLFLLVFSLLLTVIRVSPHSLYLVAVHTYCLS